MVKPVSSLLSLVRGAGAGPRAPSPARSLTPTAGVSFTCPRCSAQHERLEPAFNWPDAAFALAIPAEEQARLRSEENADVLVVRGRGYVRGWAPFRLTDVDEVAGLGLWVRLADADFADFERHERVEFLPYDVDVANQDLFLAPVLCARARLEPASEHHRRPIILFTDEDHPLTQAQRDGIPAALFHQWVVDGAHAGEPEPCVAPFDGDLDRHGWMVLAPEMVGKTPAVFSVPPSVGDLVKVWVASVAANELGDEMIINSGWWFRLDDVTRDVWSGVLDNHPRVPATVHVGSRMWFEPRRIVAHEPARP